MTAFCVMNNVRAAAIILYSIIHYSVFIRFFFVTLQIENRE